VWSELLDAECFTWNDIYNKVPVAMVSENLARAYWHDPSRALGKQVPNASGPAISQTATAGDEPVAQFETLVSRLTWRQPAS